MAFTGYYESGIIENFNKLLLLACPKCFFLFKPSLEIQPFQFFSLLTLTPNLHFYFNRHDHKQRAILEHLDKDFLIYFGNQHISYLAAPPILVISLISDMKSFTTSTTPTAATKGLFWSIQSPMKDFTTAHQPHTSRVSTFIYLASSSGHPLAWEQ